MSFLAFSPLTQYFPCLRMEFFISTILAVFYCSYWYKHENMGVGVVYLKTDYSLIGPSNYQCKVEGQQMNGWGLGQ